MNPERWQKIEELCFRALDLDGLDRRSFLEEQCRDDPDLLREVTALLDPGLGDLLLEPLVRFESDLFAEQDGNELRIGPYRVIRTVASGGMGVVYLAVRADNQFERFVALKVIRTHLVSEDGISRFLEERQILANLNHPNIARLFDGGTTEDGTPWFAMEYIEGTPVTEYCNRCELSLDKRINLFLEICDAIQYAHQNLIVHKDIKPANILVTDTGKPILLDFGIAKLSKLGREGDESAEENQILTPEYASPEQVRGDAVSTISDLYSLGVLLYVMLVGTLPYKIEERSAEGIKRELEEVTIQKPSLVKNDRKLKGDLDAIILKALHQNPQKRYNSVEQLASDLRNYLTFQPVMARKETYGYIAGRFFKRNKLGASVAVVITILILTFTSVTYFQSLEIEMQADVARAERDRAEEISLFLAELFASTDPSEAQSTSLTAVELLHRGAGRIEADLSSQPELQASLYQVISDVYESLGLYEEGIRMALSALEIRKDLHKNEHEEIATTLNTLGWLYRQTGDYDHADSLLTAALEMRMMLLGENHLSVARSLNDLGVLRQTTGDLVSTDTLLARAIEIRTSQLGRKHESVAVALSNYAALKWRMGDMESAETMMLEVVDLFSETDQQEDLRLAVALTNLAAIQLYRGEREGPEEYYRRALDIRLRLVGEKHQDVAYSMAHLGNLLRVKGEFMEAESLLTRSLELRQELLGTDHMLVGDGHRLLAELYRDQYQNENAEKHLLSAIELFEKIFPEGHLRTAQVLFKLGEIYHEMGNFREALAPLRRSLEIHSEVFGENDPRTVESELVLGVALFDSGQKESGRQYLESALKKINREALDLPERRKIAEDRLSAG